MSRLIASMLTSLLREGLEVGIETLLALFGNVLHRPSSKSQTSVM